MWSLLLHGAAIGLGVASSLPRALEARRVPVPVAVELSEASEEAAAAVPAPTFEVIAAPLDEYESLPPTADVPPPEPPVEPLAEYVTPLPPLRSEPPPLLHRVVRPSPAPVAAEPPPPTPTEQAAPAAPASVARAEVPVPLPGQNPSPDYPEAARSRGVEGEVIVRIEVAGDGTVHACTVLVSSGSVLLDDAARRAARRWRFANGPGVVEQPFRFALARSL